MAKDFMSYILKPATEADKRKRLKFVVLTVGVLINIVASMTLIYSMFIAQVTSMASENFDLLGYSLNVSSVLVFLIVMMWMLLLFGFATVKDEILMEESINKLGASLATVTNPKATYPIPEDPHKWQNQ